MGRTSDGDFFVSGTDAARSTQAGRLFKHRREQEGSAKSNYMVSKPGLLRTPYVQVALS